MYVDDSRLDGRCAFNLWSDGGSVINVTNGSELIGRNPFPGPTEIFATIVVCEKDGNWGRCRKSRDHGEGFEDLQLQ